MIIGKKMKFTKTNLYQNPIEAYQKLLADGSIDSDASQKRVMMRLQKLSEQLVNHNLQINKTNWKSRLGLGPKMKQPPRGVYIWGGVGRGKSMLMDLFFETTTNLFKSKRVHFHAFMQDVHHDLYNLRKRGKNDQNFKLEDPIVELGQKLINNTWVLCLDEFQVTDIADAMILGRLFEVLYDKGIVIVATSNRQPNDLYKDGLQRELFLPFIKKLEQTQDVLRLDNGIDYRLNQLKSIDIYLTPANISANEKLDKIFKKLSIGSLARPTSINVQGRQIQIPEAAEGVAMIDFYELCEKALGPKDFLEIAHCFHTLILKNIPQLGPEKRDVAKRFVILIDALYEARVNFICSAEVPPNLLYTKGDGTFEFQRTVSRLIEMQTTDYQAMEHAS